MGERPGLPWPLSIKLSEMSPTDHEDVLTTPQTWSWISALLVEISLGPSEVATLRYSTVDGRHLFVWKQCACT